LRSRPAWHVAHLAGRLRNAHGRLAELSAGDRDVAATLVVSYHHLAASGRRMFRLLGLVPGSTIDTYAAAALTGITVAEAESVLADLVDAHLLAEIAPGRFQLHDLLREQARRLATTEEPQAQQHEAELRLLDHYLALAGRSQATLLGVPLNQRIEPLLADTEVPAAAGYQELLEILQVERTNLLATVDWAAATGHDDHVVWLPYLLGYFLDLSGYPTEAERTHHIAIAAAERTGDAAIRAGLVGNLSAIQFSTGRFVVALETADRAEQLFQRLGDTGGLGRALNNGGNALYRMGRYPEALERYQRALALLSDDRDPTATALLINLAIIEVRLDQPNAAREHADRALAATDSPGNRQRGDALGALGGVERHVGDYRAAERAYAAAARISIELGDIAEQAVMANDLAVIDRLRGDYAAAVARHVHALRLVRSTGGVSAEAETSNDLGITLLAAGHPLLAAAAHRAALRPAQASTNRYELARAHEGIAASIAATDPSAARHHADEAMRLMGELGLPTPQRTPT
jgi:tetratricopeptide (TPR) repeat protein